MYDFRKEERHYGPVGDLVPASPLFDLYPIGFLSMLTYLAKRGFKVKIVNLAANMLLDPKLDVEGTIRKLDAPIYGIDLHWLPHVQGAIELAKLVKRHHPDSKVMLGGLSSTIFWSEILKSYGFIDFVALGDTVEKPIEMLLENECSAETVPNLAWRSEGGKVRRNEITFVPESLDEFSIDYEIVIKESLGREFLLSIPFARFMAEPIGASLAYKGCIYNCITCGGSSFAYSCFFKRSGLGTKSPRKIFEEVKSLSDYMKIPIFVLGDLQFLGRRNVKALVGMLREEKLDNTLLFEFFRPPSRDTLSLIRKAGEKILVQLSPETQIEEARFAFGKRYTNEQVTDFIKEVMALGFDRLDLYFMVGLPKQDYESAVNLPKFLKEILRMAPRGKIDFFAAPLAPFLDPGSLAFVNPGAHGYNLLFKTLEEHRRAVVSSNNWRDTLNYETAWMSREEIVKATYELAERLMKLKIERGIVSEDEGLKTIETIREVKDSINPSGKGNKAIGKETVPKGDLYPTRRLLFSLKPKFFFVLIKNLLRRGPK